jgi:hypothetical protein
MLIKSRNGKLNFKGVIFLRIAMKTIDLWYYDWAYEETLRWVVEWVILWKIVLIRHIDLWCYRWIGEER